MNENNNRWYISNEEKERYINALTEELLTLRTKAGVAQEELARIIGVSRQTYGDAERRVRPMSWSIFLSLILFFDNNKETHELLRSTDAFPYELWRRFNDGVICGDPFIDYPAGLLGKELFAQLDEQALHTIRTVIMLEYARVSGISGEEVIRAFGGKSFNAPTLREVRIKETLRRIRGKTNDKS